jgi:hypothetical protein
MNNLLSVSLASLAFAVPIAATGAAGYYIIYPQMQVALHSMTQPPPAPSPARATQADIQGLRQQLAIWQEQQKQFADEVARLYSTLSVTSTAIHNDLLRAEAERAEARARAAAVDQRYRNDAKTFLQSVPK